MLRRPRISTPHTPLLPYTTLLRSARPLGREGGPAIDVTGKSGPRSDTPLGRYPGANGSNAMAVAPGRSTDGATRLVSNSHQPWTGGVAWYELVVHSGEGWDFAGATFPGSPYPFLDRKSTRLNSSH